MDRMAGGDPDIGLGEDLTVVGSDQFFRVGEDQFGVHGLIAIESVGPWAAVHKLGPLLTIHDGFFQPGYGIGHHPHRTNERLFYILAGRVEHDDALNHIRGTMDEGDLGRLTEGIRGMLHQEWNGFDDRVTRAFILVYHPDTRPPIPVAEFGVLRAADRVRLAQGPGVETLELVGPLSPFRVNHSGLRRFADSSVADGAALAVVMAPSRGLILYPVEGHLRLSEADEDEVSLRADGSVHPEGPANLAVAWTSEAERTVSLRAEEGPARVLQVEFDR